VRRGSGGLGRLALAVAGLLLAAGAARAHGPSVEASFSGLRPKLVTIAAGDTVHFRRAGGSQLALTLVSDAGLFEGRVLDAEGWHYTFETPGDYSFHLKENPSARVRILVGPPRPEAPDDPHAGHAH
jgi:plastocyanin